MDMVITPPTWALSGSLYTFRRWERGNCQSKAERDWCRHLRRTYKARASARRYRERVQAAARSRRGRAAAKAAAAMAAAAMAEQTPPGVIEAVLAGNWLKLVCAVDTPPADE